MEDMSETFNTEIRNNIVEIKSSVSKMRNPLDGMYMRLGEAEECISDQEDRVMDNN